jgi:hypothetical protein
MMNSWLHSQPVPLRALACWKRLAHCGGAPESLADLSVRPSIFHGDLAPWNVRESHAKRTILDWERGELRGAPGWDAMHWTLMPALLVERLPATVLRTKMDVLFASTWWRDYARCSGIVGYDWPWFRCYVQHLLEIFHHVDRADVLRELLTVE